MQSSTEVGYNSKIEGDVVITRVDAALNWFRKNSLWPMPMGLACCAIELMAAGASRFDISRFGAEVMRFSPRQSDVMIVAGTVTYKMALAVRRIYDQMAEPKWVVSFGVCTCTGGFYDNYATVMGIDTIIPVDIYIPGCPPRPEYVLDGLLKLQAKIQAHPGNTPSPDLERRPEFERASGPASGLSPLPFSRAQKPDPTGQVSSSRGTQP
jgi:NADH-quinone oxidoreductase subunit B